MKLGKALLFIFCLLIIAVALPATDKKPALQSLTFGIGNDLFTYGIARNNDDFRSYGSRLFAQVAPWQLEVLFDGYTTRGWKTDWEDENTWFQGRFDQLHVRLRMITHPLQSTLPDTLFLTSSFSLGLHAAGYLGLQNVQNWVHNFIHVPEVHLPYEQIDNTKVSIQAQEVLNLSYLLSIAKTDSGNIGIGLSAGAFYIPGFESAQEAGLAFSLFSGHALLGELKVGYRWVQDYTGWETKAVMDEAYSGQFYRLRAQVGVFSLLYDYYPKYRLAFGIMSFDSGIFFQKKTWNETDFTVTVGIATNLPDTSRLLGLKFSLPKVAGLSLLTTTSYMNNIANQEAYIADPTHVPHKRFNNSDWLLQLEWETPFSFFKSWITPYVQAGIGLRNFDMVVHLNHLPESTTPTITVYDGVHLLAALQAGLRILPEGWLVFGNSEYRVDAYIAGTVMTGGKRLNKYIEAEDSDYLSAIRPFIFRAGIVLNIGLDI